MYKITIRYCTQCNWLMRSTWIAQELLHSFADEINELALIPATGGVFEIAIDGQIIWQRERDGFPDIKSLRQRVRDRIAPDKNLGHGEPKP